MSDIAELQRRIGAALDRIGEATVAAAGANPVGATATAEAEQLRAQIATEKARVAELTEKLKAAKGQGGQAQLALEEKVEAMTRQLDVQGLEVQRLRKTTIALREQLRVMNEAVVAGLPDAAVVNKALAAELDALRTDRAVEAAELDEILSELTPLIREAALNA